MPQNALKAFVIDDEEFSVMGLTRGYPNNSKSLSFPRQESWRGNPDEDKIGCPISAKRHGGSTMSYGGKTFGHDNFRIISRRL